MRRIIVGVTGASGALYAVRTVRALLLSGFEVHLVVSRFGERLLHDEAGIRLGSGAIAASFLGGQTMDAPGRIVRHGVAEMGAAISSGSFRTEGMIVVPCTTRTLSGIACGASNTLIERAADVCLKERRPVVLVVREAPLSLVHLRNMAAATEAGAAILPAAPAFYQKPRSFEDLGDFIAGRALALLGIEHALFPAWGEPEEEAGGPAAGRGVRSGRAARPARPGRRRPPRRPR